MRRNRVASAVALAGLAMAAVAAAPAQAHHDGPLAGQWHLDTKTTGGTETTPDSSGHSLDVSATTITLAAGGRFASHLASGNATTLSAGSSTLLATPQVTLVAWVRNLGAPPTLRYIAARGGDGPGQGCNGSSYALYTGVAGHAPLSFYVRPTGGGVVFSPTAPVGVWDGSWHLVAGTFDGAGVQLYVDGVPAGASTPAPGAQIDYALSSPNFTIDGYADPAAATPTTPAASTRSASTTGH